MNKFKSGILLFAFLCTFCTSKTENKSVENNTVPDTAIALRFINDYTSFCNDSIQSNTKTWIESNELTTPEFRMSYNQILDEAIKADPELGLDFDPIFNAQDYPEKGFEIQESDDAGYVTVKGKDWSDFTVVIKLKLINDKWMIDGAGVINIPKEKQAEMK